MKTTIRRRAIAFLLAACVISSLSESITLSANESREKSLYEIGLCEHHTEHDEACGYVEPILAKPCEHVHDENCGYFDVEVAELCQHEHDEECGYAETTPEKPCEHEHDEGCGYEPAVEGEPCGHEHDENCGFAEGTDETPCAHEHDARCGFEAPAPGVPCNSGCVDEDEDGEVDHAPDCAYEPERPGLPCEHEHDDECGYARATEGEPCGHKHDAECGFIETKPEEPCGHVHDENCGFAEGVEGRACEHEHDDFCGHIIQTETAKAENCRHIHDEDCGFVEGVEGRACEFVCEICAATVVDWTWDDDLDAMIDVRDSNLGASWIVEIPETEDLEATLLAILPDAVSATLKNNELATVPIRWDANGVERVELPKSVTELVDDKTEVELYLIRAELTNGYVLDEGAEELETLFRTAQIMTLATRPTAEREAEHVVTDRVTDPPKTTVNMFDYWITEQASNDYHPNDVTSFDDVVNGGINEGHVFIFAGGDAYKNGAPSSQTAALGAWNDWTGARRAPYQKLVKSKLGNDGYPHLNLADNNATLGNATINALFQQSSKRTESLGYLFSPSDGRGKRAYPNVTGLFQLTDGYYTFDATKTYAELNVEQTNAPKTSIRGGNRVTLYDTPWTSSTTTTGEFYPFNDWTDLFSVDARGGLSQEYKNLTDQSKSAEPMNHYFGMTIETEFQQPTSGTIRTGAQEDVPVVFEFSGDDDVWIFIDDILVGDLGGVHDAAHIDIDFSTGAVTWSLVENGARFGSTTLREIYNVPEGTAGWRGNTFADETVHTLKFFYLERGNNLSNASIRFNTQPVIEDSLRKVDENGDPLAGASFALYPAAPNDGVTVDDSKWGYFANDFHVTGGIITTTTSEADGYAQLVDAATNNPLTFTETFYILRETRVPASYRSNPDIVLRHYPETNTFKVVNKYETGAYASFIDKWEQTSDTIYHATYSNGEFGTGNTFETNDSLINGLAINVVVLKSRDDNVSANWLSVYGSNIYGWDTVTPDDDSQESLMRALTTAAIMQIADPKTEDWYLTWKDELFRLETRMDNLPGDATRYVANNPDGDIHVVVLFIPESVLRTHLGLTGTYTDDDARYAALERSLSGVSSVTQARSLADRIHGQLSILSPEAFSHTYRTMIYVPNEQRELRIHKVDDEGNPINGAVFAIFDHESNAAAWPDEGTTFGSADEALSALAEAQRRNEGILSFGETATVSVNAEGHEEDGMLIFHERRSGETARNGYGQMSWPSDRNDGDVVFWIKEIYAPDGYVVNENLVRIEVGNLAVYANATGFDSNGRVLTGAAAANDGIAVTAELGKLSQTLTKYAMGNSADVTLQDVTIVKQTQSSEDGTLSPDRENWRYESETFDLHFGLNDEELSGQYGLHEPGAIRPTFTVEDGYVRTMPYQNQNPPTDQYPRTEAHRDDLTKDGEPIELDGLFTLLNVVEITNARDLEDEGNLTITKTVTGVAGDVDKKFTFTITLDDESVEGKHGDATFERGVGTVELRHGETAVITRLPAGTRYVVEESKYEGYDAAIENGEGYVENGETVRVAATNNADYVIPPLPSTGGRDARNPSVASTIRVCSAWAAAILLLTEVIATWRKKRSER